MINLRTLASGVNWQILLAKILVGAVILTGAYLYGGYNCRIEHEKQKTEQAQKDAKTTIDNINKRLPEVQKEDIKAVAKREDTKKTGEKLNESLKVTPASCNLTDEQLRYFQALADKTRN